MSGNVVSFTISEVLASTSFEPSVQFPAVINFDACTTSSTPLIIILVVVSVVIVLTGVGCGVFASYYKRIPVIKRVAYFFERNKDEEAARMVQ